MLDLANIKRAHCVGIGGIHVSAVARLLRSRGVVVSGSDAVANEDTKALETHGFTIVIGHAAANVPQDAEVVIYSHAVPETNPELVEAKARGIAMFDTHSFLGELFKDAKQIVVTGTHGKSTTTALVGSILAAVGEDPTVVVGTKVPGFTEGNLRLGRSDLLVVEGDEYRRHVLSYAPTVLVLNNMELDHTDVFPTWKEYEGMFADALARVRDGGVVVWNADDPAVAALVVGRTDELSARGIKMVSVGRDTGDVSFSSPVVTDARWQTTIKSKRGRLDAALHIPGEMNARNAAMATAAAFAWKSDIDASLVTTALADFPGVWRRFERVGEYNGIPVISDYGHHPTEVRETIKAARIAFEGKRLVLCFQPHQHNRTKMLFNDFVEALDDVDVLILSEIYDVPGREEAEDRDVTSETLLTSIAARDVLRGVKRNLIYAPSLTATDALLRKNAQPGDAIVIMGAGTIDQVARALATPV